MINMLYSCFYFSQNGSIATANYSSICHDFSKAYRMLLYQSVRSLSGTKAVSTTAHLAKYTQMKYTKIECTYISSALPR